MKRLVTNFKIEQLLLAVVWMRGGGEKYSHREGTSKEKRSGGGG